MKAYIFMLSLLAVGPICFAEVVHVPSDQLTIQAGIDAANEGDTVLVENGTYTGTGNRDIDFGGKNLVLISEGGPEVTIIDCQGSESEPHRGFYFHNGENATSVVEGFSVKNGYASIDADNSTMPGGGIYCKFSSPTIQNNIIENNFSQIGAGVCCFNSSSTIESCAIRSNGISFGDGGGVYCNNSNILIKGCSLIFNGANRGGALAANNSEVLIQDCTISENSCYGSPFSDFAGIGGGIYSNASNLTLINSFIIENIAYYTSYTPAQAGGIYCDSLITLINCTVAGNQAQHEPSTSGYGICGGIDCRKAMVHNCILWGNTACDLTQICGDDVTVTYSAIQGGMEGIGNIDQNPLFINPANGDFTVCSGSPCVDAGDPTITDPDGTPSDMGVFNEYHPDCIWGKRIYVSTSGYDSTGDGSVGNPYQTAQYALDIAMHRDTIILTTGTYTENINLYGYYKSTVLTSNYIFSNDPIDIESTIINGGGIREVINIIFCDSLCEIIGLTITNGGAPGSYHGGGIYCFSSHIRISENIIRENEGRFSGGIIVFKGMPLIENNLIKNNLASRSGGGINCDAGIIRSNTITGNVVNTIYQHLTGGGGIMASGTLYGDRPVMEGNLIIGNFSNTNGGGIFCYDGIISENIIVGNHASNQGGGIYTLGDYNQSLISNTIVFNTTDGTGGGICNDDADATIENCIIAYNEGNPGSVGVIDELMPALSCCNIYGNTGGDWVGDIADQNGTNGNFSLDPAFCDMPNSDFRLLPYSPCVPYNNECEELIGALGQCYLEFRAVINIDRSGSMGITNQVGQSRFERAIQLAHEDVDKILAEYDFDYAGIHEVAVMCFNTTDGIELVQDFTTDSALLHDAIDAIPNPKHDTPLAAAMCQAHCNLNEPDSLFGYVFTYTDGRENNSQEFEICSLCQPCDQYMDSGWNYDCDPENPETCTDWQICLYNQFIENNMNIVHYFGEPIDPYVKSAGLEDFYYLNLAAYNSNGLFIYHSDFEILDYLCGDANYDANINVSDAVYVIYYIFGSGDQPIPYAAGDVNCDEMVNVSDAVWIINYVFVGGNEPCDTDGDGDPDC
jgi:hypothetical protein